MRSLILKTALFGEHPEVARTNLRDWSGYLDELDADKGTFAALRETVVGAVVHVLWRITSKPSPTTLPMAFALVCAALGSFSFAFVGQSATWLSDYHLGLGTASLAVALSVTPWQLRHSRKLSAAFIFTATGTFHVAATATEANNGSLGVQVALTLCGLSFLAIGVSSLRTKTALGPSLIPERCLIGSVALLSASQLFQLTTTPNIGLVIVWIFSATASYGFAIGFRRLRSLTISEHETAIV